MSHRSCSGIRPPKNTKPLPFFFAMFCPPFTPSYIIYVYMSIKINGVGKPPRLGYTPGAGRIKPAHGAAKSWAAAGFRRSSALPLKLNAENPDLHTGAVHLRWQKPVAQSAPPPKIQLSVAAPLGQHTHCKLTTHIVEQLHLLRGGQKLGGAKRDLNPHLRTKAPCCRIPPGRTAQSRFNFQ